MDLDFARRLREIRKQRNLTLDALAAQTGFTKGYLSKIERGINTPPIASLATISRALQIDMSELLSTSDDEDTESSDRISVVRANERQEVIRGGSSFGYDYRALTHTMPAKHMEPFVFTFPSQVLKEVYFEHEGEELIFVLSGTVEFEVGERRFTLLPGDCIYFDSTLRHRGRSVSGEAKALVVIYSPGGGAGGC